MSNHPKAQTTLTRRMLWLGGGALITFAVTLSVLFAAKHTNGTSGPSDISPGNASPQSNVLLSDDCGFTNDEGLFEPSTIQLTCGDGEIVAGRLTWSQWGATTAMGQGSINEVSCVPDCADGKDVVYKAKLTLSEPMKAGSGRMYFTKIQVSFIDRGPNGDSSQQFTDCFVTPPAPYIPPCPANERGAS
jgi:hypothetical protein